MVRIAMATLFTSAAVAAAAPARAEDEILGRWLTDEGRSTVEIYMQGKDLRGRIVHLKEPLDDKGQPKRDTHNPDASCQDRPLLGMDILWGFHYKGDRTWAGGRVYDPENGKTYHCSMRIDEDGILRLRGSLDRWGLLGRTAMWTRPPEKKPESGVETGENGTPEQSAAESE